MMASASRTAAQDRIAEIRARFGSEPEPVAEEGAHAGVLSRYTHAITRGLDSLGLGRRKKHHRIKRLVEKYREEDEPPEPAPAAVASYPFPSVKMIAERMNEEKEALRSTTRKGRRVDLELPSASLFSGLRASRLRPNAMENPGSRGFTPPRRSYPTQSETSTAPQSSGGSRVFGDGFVMFINAWSSTRSKR